MEKLKGIVSAASVLIFLICFYSFLLGNGVFHGKFDNEAIGWYFLAKGIFCSLALYLLCLVLETMQKQK